MLLAKKLLSVYYKPKEMGLLKCYRKWGYQPFKVIDGYKYEKR
ncbi:hypothetical protein [Bacillus sp. FJAT-44742]|nr:hypothetical protein [Bacillus sp. FJAT-44742]